MRFKYPIGLFSLLSLFNFSFAQSSDESRFLVQQKGGEFDGSYLRSFHIAAGISAGTLNPDKEHAAPLKVFDNSTIYFDVNPSIKFYLKLLDMERQPDLPGYKTIAIDARASSSDFMLTESDNKLEYVGPNSEDVAFSACKVPGIPPYESQGPQVAIFWRDTTSTCEHASCSELNLIAVSE